MYKLMFADDEVLIRSNIEKQIPWNSLGFELTACCANGYELLEAVEKEIPDLIITDIEMPFVSGLEVARQVKENYPGTKVVFISGYNEFEYAQKAVDFQVLKYILKPITSEQIIEILESIKNQLDEEYERNSKERMNQRFYKEYNPMIKNSVLLDCLNHSGTIKSDQLDLKALALPHLLGSRYQAAVLTFDRLPKDSEWNHTPELMEFAAYNIVSEILENHQSGYAIIKKGLIHIIQSNGSCPESITNAPDFFIRNLEEIRFSIEKYLRFTVTVGVGREIGSLNEISLSNEDALAANGYRRAVGKNQLIMIEDIEPERLNTQFYNPEIANELMSVIKSGNRVELADKLSRLLLAWKTEHVSIDLFRLKVLSLIMELVREAGKIGLSVEQLLRFEELPKLFYILDAESLFQHLEEICRQLSEHIANNRQNRYSSVIKEVLELIEQECSNPELSIAMVSEQLHLSTSYLRSIFKREMKQSFGSYLSDFRMVKAKDMILTTSLKNFEIALESGFTDAHYFSYCFKKKYGVSPNEYRSRI